MIVGAAGINPNGSGWNGIGSGYYNVNCSDVYKRQTVYTAQYADKHTEPLNFYTTNKMMVKNSDYYYEGLSGIKTGTMPESRRCFVSTATRNGFTYLLVVLGCPAYDEEEKQLATNYAFLDTENFYDWAFSTFRVKDVYKRQILGCPNTNKGGWS